MLSLQFCLKWGFVTYNFRSKQCAHKRLEGLSFNTAMTIYLFIIISHQLRLQLRVRSFGDHALCVVPTVVGKPVELLEKPDTLYNSKALASKSTTINGLVSVRYNNPKVDIAEHIYAMAALHEQLKTAGGKMDESLGVGI